KDFKRERSSARLVRDDDAWIHFTVTVKQEKRALVLVAYDFEIVFPDGCQPAFFRADLNPPDHPNAAREVRSHVHPGNDEYQWPAPVLTPREVLELFLARPGLRPRDAGKPRG